MYVGISLKVLNWSSSWPLNDVSVCRSEDKKHNLCMFRPVVVIFRHIVHQPPPGDHFPHLCSPHLRPASFHKTEGIQREGIQSEGYRQDSVSSGHAGS